VEEAFHFCQDMAKAGYERECPDSLPNMSQFVPGPGKVIRPDLPVRVLIEAATAIARPFEGKFVLNELAPSPCHGVTFDSEALVRKYEQIRAEQQGSGSLNIHREKALWLSRGEVRRIETVFLSGRGEAESLALAVQMLHDDFQTLIVPVVLFDARTAGQGVPVAEHNQWIIGNLERIQRGETATSWLTAVYASIRTAVGRLINASGVDSFA